MKGVVFTEFLDMVDDTFGFEVTEHIIEKSKSKLSTGGTYTAIGTYPHHEIIALVSSLSQQSHIPIPHLVEVFGEHLLNQFAKKYAVFFSNAKDTFTFLKSIDNHIHVEVKKLYPDAELPKFECHHPYDNEEELVMIYTSERAMSDLATGLINGTIKYYNESISFSKTIVENSQGKKVKFELKKN
ncbi:MAG: heme NO-binding domain-containing protein [Saprospiraceae bacterium]